MNVYWLAALGLGMFCALVLTSPAHATSCMFTNPLISAGQDPSVVFHEGFYYLVQSTDGAITIAKSETITGLGTAEPVTVWRPSSDDPLRYDLWAPELVHLTEGWYIYVAATDAPGNNPSHRMIVLEANTDDPLGSWTMRGKVCDPENDKWAIDGAVFEYGGRLYMVWSGWPGDEGDFPQNLYIAPMSDPLTINGPRRLIGEPDQPWERSVAALLEGPQPYIHNGYLTIVYSADASWTSSYKLGMLVLTSDNPLDPGSWEKRGPIFAGYSDESGTVYGPGHNSSPTPSPDGGESWHLYHAKTLATDGWADRAIFAQRFTWNADGTPNFGRPIPSSIAQTIPDGEPCGLLAAGSEVLSPELIDVPVDGVFELDEAFIDTGMSWINTLGSYTVAASVQLAEAAPAAAIISQDGGITSNFVLEYTGNGFAFTRYAPFGDESVSASGAFVPAAGEWVHLMGIHDVGAGELRLYINGELQDTAALSGETWSARGNTIIGAARQFSRRVGLFSGVIKDVQLYDGAFDVES